MSTTYTISYNETTPGDKTIMLNLKRNRRDFKSYSMFMGGLDVTHKNIDMLDPLRTNYVRIFITQLPKFMMDKDKEFAMRFKHYVEMGLQSSCTS